MSKSTFNKNAFIHATAGSVGGMVSMGVLYPLDQIRTYMQVSEDQKIKTLSIIEVARFILRHEGFNSFYRGIIPVVSTVGATNFVYFFSFNFGKILLSRLKHSAGVKHPIFSVSEYTALSTIAGIVTVLVTAPLWVANTRIKMGTHSSSEKVTEKNSSNVPGLLQMILQIGKNEGVRALWDGTIPSLILVSNPIIQFVIYEVVKSKIVNSSKNVEGLSGTEAFLLGAAAKACATVVTYPLQLAQNKLRIKSKHPNGNPTYTGTLDCLLKVQNQDGYSGLYRGMNAKLLQTVLNGAFMYVNYEKIVYLINQFFQHSEQADKI